MKEQFDSLKKRLKEMCIGFPQDDEEFLGLLNEIEALKPHVFVEIGTREGGSLWMLSQYLPAGATIVSIDLPGAAWGHSTSASKKATVAECLRKQGFEVHLLEIDSQTQESLEALCRVLGKRDIDFLFIDGDHSWNGILTDWRLYHHLVRSGGIVAFHDIVHSAKAPRVKVWILWDVLKTIYSHREFCHSKQGYFGIGVLWK